MKRSFLLVAGGAFAVASVSPIGAADRVELTALIASNAQHAFTEIIEDYQKKHPNVSIKPQWLGGATIAKMVDEGQPADVVMAGSAPLKKEEQLLEPLVSILQNKEVILVPKGNPGKVNGLKDLANPGVKLAVGTPSSAVGTIAGQVIQKGAEDWGFDYVTNVRKNIVVQKEKGSDVLAAVGNEANAAITFASDVDPSKYQTVEIDPKYNVVSTYQIAVVKASKNAAASRDFATYASGPAGLAVLKKFNYMPPPPK
ncbi:MAG: molybdate ABC transporter substrate-binding protein [Candidatus Eremiobacteraeota bacterium]|nr:molybdate ABC transporter substrate-binding protein [Candidatus Eremiobacteraeota bacterium]